MRLIDAVSYRKELEAEKTCCERTEELLMGLEIAIADLGDMPTIEAEPVKHGRWLQPKSGECFCSECKTLGSPHWKRCPVCEAKMTTE